MSTSISATKNELFVTTFVSIYCRHISPDDIIKCIMFFLNGDEGIPGIIYRISGNNNVLIAVEDVAQPQLLKLPLIHRLDIQQYFSNGKARPNKNEFYTFMKHPNKNEFDYNVKHAVSIKLYRYFSALQQSPEGKTDTDTCAPGSYTLVKSNSESKQHDKDNDIVIDTDECDILSFRHIFKVNEAD
eukprot:805055_1